MKTFLFATVVVVLGVGSHTAQSQLFRNLNFENALLEPPGPAIVSPEQAMPNWTSFIGRVAYNTVSIGAAAISIHDTNSLDEQPLEGRYSLLFQRSFPSGTETPWISQVGFVSTAARSLRFLSNWDGMEVTFDGEPLEIVPISDKLWGADIARFAGHTGELKFAGAGLLDGIRFSTLEIPEPSSFMLAAAGGGMLWCMRRRRTRR